MHELWYAILALMLTAYVVLDGFDLGAGALHLTVARNDTERRTLLAAIGPFWDANEVWLLAAGGALFVAFPAALASGLSGFYFAIFPVIWCLILRAVAIEFRSHVTHALWRRFWDATFWLASVLLPVLFGAALGNVIRGVPLDADGWFQLVLFTNFMPRDRAGILDWYTVLAGVFALVALLGHGAAWLAWRASGAVAERSRALVRRFYLAMAVLWPVATVATYAVNPALLQAMPGRPVAWLGLALAVGGLAAVLALATRERPLAVFLGSCAFLAGMLVATVACLYPVILRSIGDPALSITATNSGATAEGLRTALGWWAIGFPIAIAYFVLLFRIHRGRAQAAAEGEGY
jgi:cytochrome d ubiquinol oxidase subunit II